MTDALFIDDEGDGIAIVLLHAFPCDSRMWGPQSAALRAAGFRVLVPDLPGFGRSVLLDDGPSLVRVADRIIRGVESRGVDRFVLGGVSLGGYVAMAMISSRPELVLGLALCDTKATDDSRTARDNRERLAQMCLAAPDETARILEQAVLPGLLGDTTRAGRPNVVADVRSWLAEARPETVAWYQRAMAARPDSREALAGLTTPSLVVWGDEDVLSPREEQDLMLASLPEAKLVAVEKAGHLANVERPDAVTAALLDLLARVRPPS
jgi:pimeloyl-ACP methyl ester carboxylesterase